MNEEKVEYVRYTYLYFLRYCFKVTCTIPLIFGTFYFLRKNSNLTIMNNNPNAMIEMMGFNRTKVSIKMVRMHRINRGICDVHEKRNTKSILPLLTNRVH